MRRDSLHNKTIVQLFGNAVVSADGWTSYVDLQGYENALVLVVVGDLGAIDGSNHLEITLQEADADPGTIASYSAVAAADLITDAGFGALPIDVDATTLDNLTYGASYVGTKRYIAVHMDETGAVTGPIAVLAILERANLAPNIGDTPTTGAIS